MAQLSAESQDKLVKFVKNAATFLSNNFNIRGQLFERDKAYYRETSGFADLRGSTVTTAQMNKLTIPVVMPQVEGALAYLSDVFLSGFPLFPVVAKPQIADDALQLETIIQDNAVRFGYVPELLLAMRDGLKYNIACAEVTWETKKSVKVENAPLQDLSRGVSSETYYEGNRIKRLNPYNMIFDTRVDPHKQHTHAEFIGYTELWNRPTLLQYFEDNGTYTRNGKEALESGEAAYATNINSSQTAYYIPEINPQALKSPNITSTNWLAWAGIETENAIKYSNMYEVTTLYLRIRPKEFKIATPGSGKVHIWKLVVVNRKVLVYAEEVQGGDNTFPIIVAQLTEDGLGWQTKSFAENAIPFQQAASALYNSGLESQRRKVYDRIFYNPSVFNKKDMDNIDPVARIPMKAQAYGQPIQNSLYALPYRDENVATILSFSQNVTEMADIANGQNRVSRGQFQRGNKSRGEFDTTMDRSDSRNVMMAQHLEYRFFGPIKERLKLNIMQFQMQSSMYSHRTKDTVVIDPVQLRNSSVQFQLADGLTPVSRMLNLDAVQVLGQIAATNPQVMQEYDITGAIMYSLSLKGASWLQDFKRVPQPVTPGATVDDPETLANSGEVSEAD